MLMRTYEKSILDQYRPLICSLISRLKSMQMFCSHICAGSDTRHSKLGSGSIFLVVSHQPCCGRALLEQWIELLVNTQGNGLLWLATGEVSMPTLQPFLTLDAIISSLLRMLLFRLYE